MLLLAAISASIETFLNKPILPLPTKGNPSSVHLFSATSRRYIGATWTFHYCGRTQPISYGFRIGSRVSVMSGGVMSEDSTMCQPPGAGWVSLLLACPKAIDPPKSLVRNRCP